MKAEPSRPRKSGGFFYFQLRGQGAERRLATVSAKMIMPMSVRCVHRQKSVVFINDFSMKIFTKVFPKSADKPIIYTVEEQKK